ncbi:hypothetical protein GCM10027040_00940 [Halomonas shantousis]
MLALFWEGFELGRYELLDTPAYSLLSRQTPPDFLDIIAADRRFPSSTTFIADTFVSEICFSAASGWTCLSAGFVVSSTALGIDWMIGRQSLTSAMVS